MSSPASSPDGLSADDITDKGSLKAKFQQDLEQSFSQEQSDIISFDDAMIQLTIKEGFLDLSDVSSPEFSVHYFRLCPPGLYYFATPEDVKPQGVLSIKGASMTFSKSSKKKLVLITKKNTVMLRANDEHLLRSWAAALEEASVLPDESEGRQSPNLKKLARKSLSGVRRASVNAIFRRNRKGTDDTELPSVSDKGPEEEGTLNKLVTQALFDNTSNSRFLTDIRYLLLAFPMYADAEEMFWVIQRLWKDFKARLGGKYEEMMKKCQDRLFVFFRVWIESFREDFESTVRPSVLSFVEEELGAERKAVLKSSFLLNTAKARARGFSGTSVSRTASFSDLMSGPEEKKVITSKSSIARRKAPRKRTGSQLPDLVPKAQSPTDDELALAPDPPQQVDGAGGGGDSKETGEALDDIFALLDGVGDDVVVGGGAEGTAERAAHAKEMVDIDALISTIGEETSEAAEAEASAAEVVRKGSRSMSEIPSEELLARLPPEEVLVEQLTLMDLNMIRPLELREFLPLAQGHTDLPEVAPRLYSYTVHAEHVSLWVVETVFASASVKTHLAVMQYFANVMKRCFAMRNYSTTCEILRGLEHQDVQEHPSYPLLPPAIRTEIERLSVLFSVDTDCKGHFDSLDSSAVWLPYIPAYIAQASALASEPDWADKGSGVLNFKKVKALGMVAYSTMLHWKETAFAYDLREDPAVMADVRSWIMDAVVSYADRADREAERQHAREEAQELHERMRTRAQRMLYQKKTEEVVVDFLVPVLLKMESVNGEAVYSIVKDPAVEQSYRAGAADGCFDLSNTVSFVARCKMAVVEIKQNLLDLAREHIERKRKKFGITATLDFAELLGCPDDYGLRVLGIDEYIVNETLPLHRVDFLQVCSKAYVTPKLAMIPRALMPEELEEEARKKRMLRELTVATEISELVGNTELRAYLECENPEITHFRRQGAKYKSECDIEMAQLRLQEMDAEDVPFLPMYIGNVPLPMMVPDTVSFMCRFPSSDMNNKVPCSPLKTARQVRDIAFKRYCRALGPEESKGLQATDYMLKVTGTFEFVDGQNQFIAFDVVRDSLSKNEELNFSLVLREPVRKFIEEQHVSYNSMVDDLIAFEPPYFGRDHCIFNIKMPLEITIRSVDLAGSGVVGPEEGMFVHCGIYHGGHCITSASTPVAAQGGRSTWNQKVSFPRLLICNIAKGCRVCFTLYKCTPEQSQLGEVPPLADCTPLGWCARQLIAHTGHLQHGLQLCNLWPDEAADPIGTTALNLLARATPRILLEFHGMPRGRSVVYPETDGETSSRKQEIDERHRQILNDVVALDPLTDMTSEQKTILWQYRHHVQDNPHALAKLLLAVKWDNHKHVLEAHRMLRVWARPSPMQALELLDAKFSDPVVRDYGVECLQHMPPGECADFMLQLTQVVKHEPHHSSALARFLLQRAWSDSTIGHTFYWFLKAEMHIPMVAERYTILLETYLRGAPTHRRQLIKQTSVMNSLVTVAMKIKTLSSATRLDALRAMLSKLKFPDHFQLPLDQRLVAKSLLVEKCKYMDSKKLPLWLVWKNEEPLGKPIFTIFKAGDDLRQDALTLQMIKIMDKLWKNEGLDLLLHPYGCIATGDEIGMIEVVLNSETTANINKAAGGTKAVFNKETLRKWIKQHNPSKQEFAAAQHNFMLSCAGYCVATYVLGIGDRHNDNIMVTKQGHLFHIDFGHFLGNFKEKFGFKRERAPFVFTPQYAAVLGGPKDPVFAEFIDYCCRAYNIVRKRSTMFINLFQMMLCTGIPELRSTQDMEYLRKAFSIGVSDEGASAHFTQLIYDSLATKTTVLNDAIHVFVHSDKKKKKDKKKDKKDKSG